MAILVWAARERSQVCVSVELHNRLDCCYLAAHRDEVRNLDPLLNRA